MAEKPLKSLKFHGLDDIYTIPTGGNIEIEFEGESTGTPSGIDADSLGGILAKDFATKNFVSSEIAKAKLDGTDQNVDLSGYATKDELRLTAEQVGAATSESVNTAKAEVTSYVNEQVKKAAPRNLLDNSDFRNPVNQRGQTSYTGVGYTIDRWISINAGNTTTIFDNGVHFQSVELGVLRQYLDVGERYTNKKMTIAAKFTDGTIHCASGTMVGGSGTYLVAMVNSVSGRFELYRLDNKVMVQFGVENGDVSIEWAALYEGEYTAETLPEYQSKGYEQELLICRQYDPSTGEYIGLKKFGSARNLLDNSDFTNPINQRGLNNYAVDKDNATKRITIDRWWTGAYTQLEVASDGIILTDHGYIAIEQVIEVNASKYGKKFTGAICIDDGTDNGKVIVCTGAFPVTESSEIYQWFAETETEDKLWLEMAKTPKDHNLLLKLTLYSTEGATLKVKWACVYEGEYTAETLPEYQPKGYGAELAECLRYYWRPGRIQGFGYVYSTTTAYVTFISPVVMRTTPTLSIKDMELTVRSDGKTVTVSAFQSVYVMNGNTHRISFSGSGLTANQTVHVDKTSGVIEFNADL